MRDALDRKIDYMRVSITDRCNLRCKYCMPNGLPDIPHDKVLRYEEILRVCGVAARLGIRTIKITGGEPFARKGCINLLRALKAVDGIENVTLTTNGVLLEPHIEALKAMGINGVNISLDTLNRESYRRITGQDEFQRVWSSLLKAVKAGLPVKINCVPMREINGPELAQIAALAEKLPVEVRFIELMPTNSGENFSGIGGSEILRELREIYPDLEAEESPQGAVGPERKTRGFGPARYYRSERLRGAVGFIDAVSNHFCAACNRVRLTSDGFLKLCLYHDDGIDLKALLQAGADDETLAETMAAAIQSKPERHFFGSRKNEGIRSMSKIGG